ncbi:MAG TPA: hypothetical protein VML35_02405 [Gaiellaceae bacterium]|nr:hypothetical protein [Gaiellaceae bacterium]
MTRILLVCLLAASAGVHLALAAEHGASFHVAAGLLALAAGTLALRPGREPAAAAGVLLAGLLAAYLVAGEGLDAVAGMTKAIEAAGLLLAVRLVRAGPARPTDRVVTLLAAAMIAVFAAAVTPAALHDHAPDAPPHGH